MAADVYAQTGTDIRGTVTDAETGEPLPGVNVVVQNTTTGTATDIDGAYRLTIPGQADSLVFSFVGYLPQTVAINGRTVIDVALAPDVERLEEVLVVGYGTQQRALISGSITSLPAAKLEEVPITSFEGGLQGQLPGVTVQEPSGEPGATPTIRVRGTGSISAGNEPLYVIDGFPLARDVDLQGDLFRRRDAFRPPPANPLSALNPGDIASIEVLKDASAAAIYGSRGSNGVVLITTKKGRTEGRPVIRFDSYIGTQSVANVPEMMNAEEVIAFTRDARNNNYVQKYDPLNPDSPDYNPAYDPNSNEGRPDDAFVLLPEKYVDWDGTDTDWLDVILEPAPIASSTLSLSGGSGTTSYYLSGGYLSQDGIIDGSGFQRYSGRANIVTNPLNWLQVGVNLTTAFTDQDRLPAGSPYFARPPGIVYSALVHSPVIRPYNDDGTPNQLDNQSYLGGGTTSASNPIAIRNSVSETLTSHRTFGNAYAEAELVEGLRYKLYFGADLVDYTRSFYRASSLLYRTALDGETYGQSGSSNSFNWLLENTLSYDRTFDDAHTVSAVVGYTAQREQIELNDIIAQNYPDDEVTTINGGQVTDANNVREEWSLVSFLSRVNYSYQGRYLLTATLRTDRSSRFGADNQTGVFPSGSIGWNVSQEPFFAVDAVNNLKLRASYGVTGNFFIPNYGSVALLDQNRYITNDQIATGVAPITLGNEELTWETTRSFNAGLDAAFLQDRIYFTAEFYNSVTSDLLLFVNIPSSLGFTTALTNIGEVRNRGFEFSVTSRNIVGDFEWSTDFNISTNANEVLELGPDGDPILSAGGAGIRHITRIGDPVGSYYGWVVEGVYQDEADIAASPVDQDAPDPRPGDFKFQDVNGDGVIDDQDRTVTGSYFPDYTFGLTNTFAYRGFDLNVFLQGVQGNEILNLTSRHLKNGEANFNSYAIFNDRWQSPENPGSGDVPRADRQSGLHGNNNRPSSFQVEDGSYIRLRNVTVGYTIDGATFNNRMRSARIYLTGTNLWTSTDYLGFNPEVNNQSQVATTPGEDYGAYPLARTWTLGVNLTF